MRPRWRVPSSSSDCTNWDCPTVVGVAWPENVESQRVLRKIGMREQGTATHYGRTMRVFVAQRRQQA